MAGAVLALVVLVILPLAFLVGGSLTGDGGLTLAHFRDAVSSRLYVQALRNSLVLGGATAVLSVAIGLPLGLYLVEYGPPIFARKATRFSKMPREDGQAYLEAWQFAGGLRGALFLGLRTLVFLSFYQHPDVLKAMGVDWQGRAEELVRRRAELLA